MSLHVPMSSCLQSCCWCRSVRVAPRGDLPPASVLRALGSSLARFRVNSVCSAHFLPLCHWDAAQQPYWQHQLVRRHSGMVSDCAEWDQPGPVPLSQRLRQWQRRSPPAP